jgi:serine beta-lactamase-like protein LACTB, mitochondrial
VSKSWNRKETWIGLVVLAVGAVPAGILGLHLYVTATATLLHPEPGTVPSVTRSDPSAAWGDAVERGRQIMRAGLSEQNLPGLSVAVGVGDEIVWAEGFGWADLDTRVPVAPATLFRIGTASTALTSAAVGVLLEQGRLNLDEQIQAYVPEFPKQPWPVTLRQVMGHVAGVRNDGGDEGPLFTEHCERPVEALPFFADRPLLFEPGTRYRFSSYGWILVSATVETAAEEPLLTFMRTRVFAPLGMEDTMADTAPKRVPGAATAYFPRYAADPRYGLHLMRDLDFSCYAGATGLLSTPSDMVRFGLATTGSLLLQPATIDVLQTPQRLATGEETGYGLGWDLEAVTLAGEPARWVGHDGTLLGGMVTSLMTFPEHEIVVSVMSNISYADTEALALAVAQEFAGKADQQ